MSRGHIQTQPLPLYRIVVTHYLLAAINFLLLAILILYIREDLTGHYFQPKLLAITHIAALGWATLIIFGACYQLLPVILETNLFSYRMAWLSFGLFVIGFCLLIHTFWVFDPGIYMQAGSILLLTGITLFAINAFITARRIKKTDIYQDLIMTSCMWLIATAVLGVLLVFNFRYAFLPKDHLLFLKLHAHMGIVGWFMMLIIGVSGKLLPMFLVSVKQDPRLLNYSYTLINLALLAFMIDTYLFGLNMKTYFIALTGIAGVVFWLVYVFQCFSSRIRKALDIAMYQTLVSKILLGFAIIALPFIVFYQLKADAVSVKLTTVYGSLLLMGWISSLILGQTFKTLPFIVWTQRYQDIAGKQDIPLPAHLYHAAVLKLQCIAYISFVIGFFTGIVFEIEILIYAGLLSFLLTALCYLGNVLLILFHVKAKTP